MFIGMSGPRIESSEAKDRFLDMGCVELLGDSELSERGSRGGRDSEELGFA